MLLSEIFRPEVQLTSAIVDLITGLILIPLLFVLKKKGKNKELTNKWLYFFFCLSIGDILGFVVHAFVLDEFYYDYIWVFIYFFMFEIAKMFLDIALYDLGKPFSKKYKMIFDVISFIVYLVAVVNGFVTVDEIRIFVIYAVIVDLPAFVIFIYLAFKKKDICGKIMIGALFPQLFGLYFQLTKTGGFHLVYQFNHDGIYHICLLLSVIIFFVASLYDSKNERRI